MYLTLTHTLLTWISNMSQIATKQERPGQSKADSDMVWKHDKYNGPGKTLGSRLSDNATLENDTPRVDFSKAVKAVRQAAGVETKGISIKGAGSGTLRSNVVHVDNLTQGTTPADVEVCSPFVLIGVIIDYRF